MRHPLGRVARVGLLHHAVDLLEREALGLGHEEVGVHEADGAERAPDEEHLGAEVALVGSHHVWGDDTDDLNGVLVAIQVACRTKGPMDLRSSIAS